MSRNGFTLLEVLITLVVLSVGGLAVLKNATETQDLMAEIGHLDTMSRLATTKAQEVVDEGLASGMSRSGGFEGTPDYEWNVESHFLRDAGWFRMVLVVRRKDTGRQVVVERIFRELL